MTIDKQGVSDLSNKPAPETTEAQILRRLLEAEKQIERLVQYVQLVQRELDIATIVGSSPEATPFFTEYNQWNAMTYKKPAPPAPNPTPAPPIDKRGWWERFLDWLRR